MRIRIPVPLAKQRNSLHRERLDIEKRLAQVARELESLDYAIKIISPGWKPPSSPPRRALTPSRLPHGTIAENCLEFLRDHHEGDTSQITTSIKKRYDVQLKSKREEQDFASAVATALRRYQRKGVVEIAGRHMRTGTLRWRLCTTTTGALRIVRKVASV
jgi:hypothetical protein